MMVSQHYPFLFSHPQSWLIVALIIVSGAADPPHAQSRRSLVATGTVNGWTLPSPRWR